MNFSTFSSAIPSNDKSLKSANVLKNRQRFVKVALCYVVKTLELMFFILISVKNCKIPFRGHSFTFLLKLSRKTYIFYVQVRIRG